MSLYTHTSAGSSTLRARWHAVSDFTRRRADAEFTLGLDEEWDDAPTDHLDYEVPTQSIEPPLPPLVEPAPMAAAPPIVVQPSPAQRDISTGSVLCDRYVLGHLLGAGGSSLIFQAQDRLRVGAAGLGSRVALKVLRPEMRSNSHALTRLRREFRQMQRLSHPGIARVHELSRDDDIWFMTMELIEGQTVSQWLKSSTDRITGLQIIGACCEALHHAHEAGVVHGDLKPSNVLVLPNGGVKLVDFGSAAERDTSMSIIDTERSFAATPPYASPQVLAGEAADPRDDVFSLACLTYAVLTQGEHPFDRKSSTEAQQAQLRPVYARGISARQFGAIVRALSWERDQRPASVREFLDALLASDLRHGEETGAATPADVRSDTQASAQKRPTQNRPAQNKPAQNKPAQNKKKWQWPWQRSASLAMLLAATVAIVGAWFAWGINWGAEATQRAEAQALPAVPMIEPEQPLASESPPAAAVADTSKAPEAQVPVNVKPKPAAAAPGEISFTTRTLRVGVNQTVAALSVQRLHSTRGRAKVVWTIEGGTALNGVHYRMDEPQAIEFLDGQSVRSLFIPLLPDTDAASMRHSKTFTVKLQQAAGGPALGEIKQVYVTIVGDVADERFTANSVTHSG
jgi:serine/threonine protein kinase